MKKYEIKEKNSFKLFPKKLFGLPRLFGFAQHPCIKMTETKNNRLVALMFRLWSYFSTTTESILMWYDKPGIGSSEYSLLVFSIFGLGVVGIIVCLVSYAGTHFIYTHHILIKLGIISAVTLPIILGL